VNSVHLATECDHVKWLLNEAETTARAPFRRSFQRRLEPRWALTNRMFATQMASGVFAPYSTAGWENFFVAEVGASAALTGLLFVAVSINLSEVLKHPQLPGRAAESLLVLTGVLLASTFGLVPGQPRQLLASELLLIGLLVWAFPVKLQFGAHIPGTPRHWLLTRVVSHQLATLPLLVSAISLLAGVGGGLYWLVAMTVFSFADVLINAWVLLIEIQR